MKNIVVVIFFHCCALLQAQEWQEKSFNGIPRNVVFTKLYDWDHDGVLDILALEKSYSYMDDDNGWQDRLVLYENKPTFGFKHKIILSESLKNPHLFNIVDFDKNGKEDILFVANDFDHIGADFTGSIAWFQHQPNGTYIKSLIKDSCAIYEQHIVDVNRDGYSDIFAVIKENHIDPFQTKIFLNDKKGKFREVSVPHAAGLRRINIGDVNKDGFIDIVGFNDRSRGFFSILFGLKNGSFSEPEKRDFIDYHEMKEFRLKDYNEDGYLDMVVIYYEQRGQTIILDGSRHFELNPDFKIVATVNLADEGLILPVDFNKDKILDCLYASFLQNGLIKIHDTNLNLSKTIDQGFKKDKYSMMVTGDLDADGDLDLVYTVNHNVGSVFLWFENIEGELYPHMIAGRYEEFTALKVADFDLDGDEDILFSCSNEDHRLTRRNGVYLYENKGNGKYTDWFVAPFHHTKKGLRFEDIDQDGDIDIIGVSTKDKSLLLYENNQIPYAWTVQTLVPNMEPSTIFSTANTTEGTSILTWSEIEKNLLTVYTKSETGSYVKAKTLATRCNNIISAELIDFSGNGQNDLAVLCQDTSKTLEIYHLDDWTLSLAYSFKGYKGLEIKAIKQSKSSKSGLLIWGEKKENVELLYLKKEGDDFQKNKVYGFQEQSRNLFFRCSPYLFQTKDQLVIQDNGELHTIVFSNPGSTSFEKQALPPSLSKRKPLMFFALGDQQGNELGKMIAAMYDGYISIFEKKK